MEILKRHMLQAKGVMGTAMGSLKAELLSTQVERQRSESIFFHPRRPAEHMAPGSMGIWARDADRL